MTTIQEQPSPTLKVFNDLVQDLHNAIDTITSQVTNTIDARDPSLVSDKSFTPASSELLNAFRKFVKLSDEFSSYTTSPSEHLTMIAGEFYESTALNVVSELGIADLIGKGEVPVSLLARKVDVDESRLRELAMLFPVLWGVFGLQFLGHLMRMLANRQVFRETEYGSDVFVNNRMSSILLSSHEKNLRGFIGHWCECCLHLMVCELNVMSA